MSDQSDDNTADKHIITVDTADAGQRLDKWLVSQCPDLSRSRIKSLVEDGQLTQENVPVTGLSKPVKAGTTYTLIIPAPLPATPQAENIPLDIIYEDDDLVVVNKPAGMVVHPAAGAPNGTLVNALLHHCGDSLSGIGGVARPGIVHRIDKDTSGLLVVAKHDQAHRGLAAQFEAKTSERQYRAITKGIPSPAAARITGNIARHPVDRKRMAVSTAGGKPAATHYQVVRNFTQGSKSLAAEIICRLETGRTHQVRVHMAHIGHPLIGDPVYTRPLRAQGSDHGALNKALALFARQALHAEMLGFIHPTSGEHLQFTAQLPHDMSNLLKAFAPYSA